MESWLIQTFSAIIGVTVTIILFYLFEKHIGFKNQYGGHKNKIKYLK